MRVSTVKKFLDDEKVIDGFELGADKVVVTESGIGQYSSHSKTESTSEYEKESNIGNYSFIKFGAIRGVDLIEKASKESPTYLNEIILMIMGVFVSSMGVGVLKTGEWISVGLFVLLAGLGLVAWSIAGYYQKSESHEKGTYVKIYVDSDVPEEKWVFRSDTVGDENFQEFVQVMADNLN